MPEGGYARYASPPPVNAYAQQQQQHPNAGPYDYSHAGGRGVPQHQQQQQQQGQFGNFGNFASFAAGAGGQPGGSMLNDATAQMGVQFGRQMADAGQEYVGRNVSVTHCVDWRGRRLGEATSMKSTVWVASLCCVYALHSQRCQRLQSMTCD